MKQIYLLLAPKPQPVSFAVTIFTFIKMSPAGTSVHPERLFPPHIEKKVLFIDIVQTHTREEAFNEALENYRQSIVPHPQGKIASMQMWQQHVESFPQNNFYIDAAPIYAYEFERATKQFSERCTKFAKESQHVIEKMRLPQ